MAYYKPYQLSKRIEMRPVHEKNSDSDTRGFFIKQEDAGWLPAPPATNLKEWPGTAMGHPMSPPCPYTSWLIGFLTMGNSDPQQAGKAGSKTPCNGQSTRF